MNHRLIISLPINPNIYIYIYIFKFYSPFPTTRKINVFFTIPFRFTISINSRPILPYLNSYKPLSLSLSQIVSQLSYRWMVSSHLRGWTMSWKEGIFFFPLFFYRNVAKFPNERLRNSCRAIGHDSFATELCSGGHKAVLCQLNSEIVGRRSTRLSDRHAVTFRSVDLAAPLNPSSYNSLKAFILSDQLRRTWWKRFA